MQSIRWSSRPSVAVAVVMTVVALGPAWTAPAVGERPTIAELSADLGKGDATARSRAIRRLAAVGPVDESVAVLVPTLADADPGVRFTAALAIAALADRDQPGDETSKEDGSAAADAAGDNVDGDDEQDPFAAAVKALLPLLADADPHLVRAAATAIGAIGPVDGAERTDDVIDGLRRGAAAAKDAETHAACIVAIGDYGPAAESAVGQLTVALKDKTALVREAAAAALAAIGPEARAATSVLASLVRGDEPLVRAAAAAALAGIGPDARDAVAALAGAITDESPLLRGTAVRAIAAIGPDAASATGPLVRALASERDADVTVGILDAFAEIGPGAREAVPVLVERLSDGAEEPRLAATIALGEIGPAAAATAADAVGRLLNDRSSLVRVAAAGALIGMERATPRVRQVLSEALASSDSEVVEEAARTIGDWGAGGESFSKPLGKLVTDAKAATVRAAAAAALGDIGASDAIEPLGTALDDDDAEVRYAAAYAIADLPQIASSLEAAVTAAADDEDVRVRMEVATILARIGTPTAKKALDALAHDEDANVAEVAKTAATRGSRETK